MDKINFDHQEDLNSENINLKQDLTSWDINQIVLKEGLTNDLWIPYHCKCVRKLGAAKYCQLANLARKSKRGNAFTLMSKLLKEEMDARG